MNSFKKFLSKTFHFIALAFSENGNPSSKRILAGVLILGISFCMIWSDIRDGMTENLTEVLKVSAYCATTLLGVTTVTAIWKQPQKQNDNDDTAQ